jgi:hypothetical protein
MGAEGTRACSGTTKNTKSTKEDEEREELGQTCIGVGRRIRGKRRGRLAEGYSTL